MLFDGKYFQQIFGIIKGTNVVPILANIYMAKLEKLLKEKYKLGLKLKWPILFKRFIDDGFGILEGNKLDFDNWVTKFNLLRETITIDKIWKLGTFYGLVYIQIYIHPEQKRTSKTCDS